VRQFFAYVIDKESSHQSALADKSLFQKLRFNPAFNRAKAEVAGQ